MHHRHVTQVADRPAATPVPSVPSDEELYDDVHEVAQKIDDLAGHLKEHLMEHLAKEETNCLPLVVQHLDKKEITDLVGQIMGKRSSDQISQIMTMAVENLSGADREGMVLHMKKAMAGTFFERWLSMSGWQGGQNGGEGDSKPAALPATKDGAGGDPRKDPSAATKLNFSSASPLEVAKRSCQIVPEGNSGSGTAATASKKDGDGKAPTVVTNTAELEKLIRAVMRNGDLTPFQKNTTIQGLRASLWMGQKSRKRKLEEASGTATGAAVGEITTAVAACNRWSRRSTPPTAYWKIGPDRKTTLTWKSGSSEPVDSSVPLFSPAELAPTYNDGATGAVLGCPHYARAVKLRHPSSGRLYTCRLCCEQEREMPMKDQDSNLDRYNVTEVLCMPCGALQPAGEKCRNPKCEFSDQPFAKYFCKICNLYDDNPDKNIYHCPFCNVCRAGKGLGIDFRHCMRCNACVPLSEDHQCIPQRLQGNCPICHESVFQSTQPLRGLKCGHVMHLSCFLQYRRGNAYTCPLCKKSAEDMSEYFALLDAAVRMQPMPAAYAEVMSNIYCQDCCKSGPVSYHFVGCKCAHCGSYNTRELSRGMWQDLTVINGSG